jgi:murein DD-endopeptidase MepM/ murein hydrolase activator NlpD
MGRILGLIAPLLFCYIVFTQFVNAISTDSASIVAEESSKATAGANLSYFPVKDHTTANIISYFGDPRGKSRKHLGVDIKADRHTPVVAVLDGKVEAIKEGGNGGKTIYLRAADGVLYFYAHLEDWLVKEGAMVDAGEEIATVGNSGNASRTTPHLHFEIMQGEKRTSIDPLPMLEELN